MEVHNTVQCRVCLIAEQSVTQWAKLLWQTMHALVQGYDGQSSQGPNTLLLFFYVSIISGQNTGFVATLYQECVSCIIAGMMHWIEKRWTNLVLRIWWPTYLWESLTAKAVRGFAEIIIIPDGSQEFCEFMSMCGAIGRWMQLSLHSLVRETSIKIQNQKRISAENGSTRQCLPYWNVLIGIRFKFPIQCRDSIHFAKASWSTREARKFRKLFKQDELTKQFVTAVTHKTFSSFDIH